MLQTLTPLLISGFSHIPEPALGPSAFKSFWGETYQLIEQLEGGYPEDLKPILRNIQETMCVSGEVLAPGLSPETQTQDPKPVSVSRVSTETAHEHKAFDDRWRFHYWSFQMPRKRISLVSPSTSITGPICHRVRLTGNLRNKCSERTAPMLTHLLETRNLVSAPDRLNRTGILWPALLTMLLTMSPVDWLNLRVPNLSLRLLYPSRRALSLSTLVISLGYRRWVLSLPVRVNRTRSTKLMLWCRLLKFKQSPRLLLCLFTRGLDFTCRRLTCLFIPPTIPLPCAPERKLSKRKIQTPPWY